jgi:cyclophilin family peptidyl-prolyl cis-trans isomerase
MRVFLILAFSISIFNCENAPSKPKPNTSIQTTDTTSNAKVSKLKNTPPQYPVLNTSNAMEYFLEYEKQNKQNKVRMVTDFGAIDILLFNETKFHRANFIYLATRKYYDSTQFYRVINNFMIQGGSSDDKKTGLKRRDIGRYLLPVDGKKGFKHDRGTISMPSSDIENPHKLASPYEFFIVQQRGGAHYLNGNYTVFGKVIKGMDVVDKIAAVDTDKSDWPRQNVYIKTVKILE